MKNTTLTPKHYKHVPSYMAKRPLATSDTHPLIVDWVPLPGVPGRLGITFAPGKVDSAGRGANWSRDLRKDTVALVSKGVHVVVPLIEDHELKLLQIPTLVSTLESAGLTVKRHPIVDGSVPKDRAAFGAFVNGLASEILAGRAVVVHCRGGMGRAGTAAACVLIRLGVDAHEAMKMVRKHRVGAIENHTQEHFILAFGGKTPVAKDYRLPAFVTPRQKLAYQILAEGGPLTRSEIHRAAMKMDRTAYSIAARLPEMERMGLVQRYGTGCCQVTNKTVTLWRAIPQPTVVPAPKRARITASKRELLARRLETGTLTETDTALIASILRGV